MPLHISSYVPAPIVLIQVRRNENHKPFAYDSTSFSILPCENEYATFKNVKWVELWRSQMLDRACMKAQKV